MDVEAALRLAVDQAERGARECGAAGRGDQATH